MLGGSTERASNMNSAGKLALAAFAGVAAVGIALFALRTPSESEEASGTPQVESSSSDGRIESRREDAEHGQNLVIGSSVATTVDRTTPEREAVAPSDAPPVFDDKAVAPVRLPSDPLPLEGFPTAGVVIDSAGSGVPGVKVWIERYSEIEAATDAELLEVWRSTSALDTKEKEVMDRPHLAETDASGSFVLPAVPRGRMLVKAVRSGYQIDLDGAQPVEVGEGLRFRATRKVQVELKVLDDRGNDVRTARLRIRRGEQWSDDYWNSNDPTLLLPEGECAISAISVGGASSGLESKPKSLVVRDGMEPIEIVLGGQGSIALRMSGDLSTRGFATWDAYCVPAGVVPPTMRFAELKELVRARCVDPSKSPDEATQFQTLDPGHYEIFVFPFQRAPCVLRKTCEVKDTREVLEFDLRSIDLPTAIRCEVRVGTELADSIREYVTRISYRLEARFEDRTIEVPIETANLLLDREVWLVPEVESWADLVSGRLPEALIISVRDEDLGSGTTTILPGVRKATVDLKPEARGALRVEVRGADALLAQSRSLYVLLYDENADGGAQSRSSRYPPFPVDATGVVDCGNPVLGRYEVRLVMEAMPPEDRDSVLAATVVDLATTSLARLEVPPLHSFEVTVSGPSEKIVVRLSPIDGGAFGDRSARCESGGTIRFDAVPAGRWTVLATALDSRAMLIKADTTITVPTDRSILLELAGPTQLRVWITSPDGLLAKAGLRDGDSIVAVNDARFDRDGVLGVSRALQKSQGAKVRFTVVRDGVELEIDWEAPPKPSPELLGGSMTFD